MQAQVRQSQAQLSALGVDRTAAPPSGTAGYSRLRANRKAAAAEQSVPQCESLSMGEVRLKGAQKYSKYTVTRSQ